MDYGPPGSSVHSNSPGKNAGVDCHFLFQGIFPTNTFYNREQEKEAKAQEKERKKETRHAQILAALQRLRSF